MDNIFGYCKSAAVIVAHPDDETLWCGGVMLANPQINWTILALCRKSDTDRSPKFFKAAAKYNATGLMADLDDGPEQLPLAEVEIQRTILDNLPRRDFDLILTHSPKGEYTRHRRHEETSGAVFSLWQDGKLKAEKLLMFAYEDGERKYPPRPIQNADVAVKLTKDVLKTKKEIIIGLYGFSPSSFEAKAVCDMESFWQIQKPEDIEKI